MLLPMMGTRETPTLNHKEPPKVVVLWVQWGRKEQSSDFKHLTWLPCLRELFRKVNLLFLCVAAPEISLSYVIKTAFLITKFRISPHHNSQIEAAPWRSLWLCRHSKAYRVSKSRWVVQSRAWENIETHTRVQKWIGTGGWMGETSQPETERAEQARQ